MSNSFAQATKLTCSQCHQSFTADVWLIVDVTEHPDLLERIQAATLHDLPCPHCGYVCTLDVPLLVYRPDDAPHLTFSPTQSTSDEEAPQQASNLLDMLFQTLGSAWQDTWLAQMAVVPRPLLAATLRRVPEHLRQHTMPSWLDIIDQFIGADSWGESQRIVATYPELLDEVTDVLLALLASLREDNGAGASWEEHRTLLRRCREVGIDQAFAEKTRTSGQMAIPTELQDDLRQAQASDENYLSTSNQAELDNALVAWQRILNHPALATTPLGVQLAIFNDAGGCFLSRYWVHRRIDDLNQALRLWTAAVAQTAADAPNRPAFLTSMGNGLCARYARTGQLEDLDQAIAAYQQAVTQTAADAPDRHAILTNLGGGLHNRYTRTGRLEDLEQAIAAFQQAVAQISTDAPDWPLYLNNLGGGLCDRYAHTRRLEDLEQAIGAFQQAVTHTATDVHYRPAILTNLGSGLRDRYTRTGRLEDLEQAIGAFQQAVTQTTADATAQPIHLNNLGAGLRTHYTRTGRLEDLEQAIVAFQQAVAQTTTDATDQPLYLNNLGGGLRDRYAHTGRLEDLEQGTKSYRQACEQGLAVALADALLSARNWGGWAVARSNWEEASVAYHYGLTAIDRLFAVQLVRSTQESALGLGRGLHARAAYALARNGDLATAATTVERGRARLLAEALQRNRADLLLLPARGHADLYQRYRDAVDHQQALRQQAKPEVIPIAGFRLTDLERLQALTAAQAEIDATITAIQQIPGYEDFFAQPTLAQLQDAAQAAPLVYLLTTEAGGLALIVQADKVTPVWWDGFTEEKLGELINEWFGAYRRQRTAIQTWLDTMDRVTHVLWDAVMGSVTAALHDLAAPPTGATPSVTLIPTGLLSLLPLHAAWTEGEQAGARRYFLDEFVVNYAPSARALTHATTTAQQVNPLQLLAVDEPRPVRGNALPNSAAEVAAIADHFVQPQLFQHEAATQAAILAALPQAQVAHFSCHGGTNWENALESGLFMANDEPLTVRDLLELQLPGARLATLSACETGIVGTKLPDEVVALPSALVQAGFAGVAASLWSVADISTAMLMARFYDFWRKEKLEPAQALRAAQRWVRDTTNREKADYFGQEMLEASGATRMPEMVAADFFSAVMMHKDGQDARSFAHPYWWAAFYLTGV